MGGMILCTNLETLTCSQKAESLFFIEREKERTGKSRVLLGPRKNLGLDEENSFVWPCKT